MRTIKLYAHEEHDDIDWNAKFYAERASDPSVTPEEVRVVLKKKPLYEVEFTFDVDTGKCVQANVDGVILTP